MSTSNKWTPVSPEAVREWATSKAQECFLSYLGSLLAAKREQLELEGRRDGATLHTVGVLAGALEELTNAVDGRTDEFLAENARRWGDSLRK